MPSGSPRPSWGTPASGHRGLSPSEVMGTTHFALNQAHDVLHREREDISKKRLCLLVWVFLLK
jgi:hypothetical protein